MKKTVLLGTVILFLIIFLMRNNDSEKTLRDANHETVVFKKNIGVDDVQNITQAQKVLIKEEKNTIIKEKPSLFVIKSEINDLENQLKSNDTIERLNSNQLSKNEIGELKNQLNHLDGLRKQELESSLAQLMSDVDKLRKIHANRLEKFGVPVP
jgi:hypothetical protein